jgi:hypothetical protein
MSALRKAVLGLLLLSPIPILADTITDLSGRLHTPGETINYSFSVQTIVSNSFVEDVLNGFVRLTGSGAPRTITISNDQFIFGLNESIVMLEFGSPVTYQLTGDVHTVEVIRKPSLLTARATFAAVATPEPGTLLLLLAGLIAVKKR